MTAWAEYKKKLGETRPWDALNPNAPRVDTELAESRLAICLGCPRLIQVTKQCKECGCFMGAKVKLANASCPLGHW